MKSPTYVLYKAQVDRLRAQTDYKLFDANPQNEPYPYVVMGEVFARDWSDKFIPGQEVLSTIHIWSQYEGRKEADEMADVIEQALTLSPLDLGPDFHAVVDSLDSYSLIIDIDGVTRHGILKFRYLIEEV
jgi:hypothetical protein